MRDEKSAGGIVFYKDNVLVLKKFNGDYVLPKGRVEDNEDKEETAKREVFEETGVRTETIKYLGEIHYTYSDHIETFERVHKTVYWFLMKGKNSSLTPQREEGFVEAKYFPINKAINILRYDDEREILKVAIDNVKGEVCHSQQK